MADSWKFYFIIITNVLLLRCAVVVNAANKYNVDEEYNEQGRLRSTFQTSKERILIGYLAGTPLFYNANSGPDYPPRNIPLQVPSADDTNSEVESKLLLRKKLLFPTTRRKRRRRAQEKMYRDPKPLVPAHLQQQQQQIAESRKVKDEKTNKNHIVPTLSPVVNRDKCDDEGVHLLSIEEQAKCFKQRPASINLQGSLISGALRYAVEKINADKTLLPNHTLDFTFVDTRGIPHLSVKAFMDLWSRGATAFIGPEDSCQTEAMMAAAQNLPMISFKCFDHTVSDKRRYNTFARTAPTESEISKAVISLLKHYNWIQFSIIHGNNDVNNNLVEAVKADSKKAGLKLLNVTDYPIPFMASDDNNAGAERISQIVAETHKKTRIYLFFGDLHAMRHMLYEMDEQNLFVDGKSEYMVIYVNPAFTYITADDASMNQIYRPTVVSLEEFHFPEFKRIVDLSRVLLMIIPSPVQFNRPDYHDFISAISSYVMAPPFNFFKPSTGSHLNLPYQLRFNRYASYLYDAVYLYARGLHQVLLEGGSPTNGTAIISKILNQPFQSMQGFKMKIDENGDAHGNYTLLARQKFSTSQFNLTHGMIQTAHFVQTSDSLPALQLIDKLAIDWATYDGLVPKDMPDCGFNNEFCIKENTYVTEILCGILAGLLVIISIIGFSMYRNHKYEQELAGLIWKIDPKEIQFRPVHGLSGVAGSRVTIGSQDSGDGAIWLSNPSGLAMYKGSLVAIKTITYLRKVREITRATKIEMKNMRSLHHDNINSFMGIIVESNCIRVVREYCAKGSLFDVLLNENIKLDQLFVASFVDDLLKGMTYLHESELRVHGNLKSTNCVVSSRWSLQVSDFGLHELRDGQEYENEDSRYFNLLWVAPELLLDDALINAPKGTQKADVYSFAVILHEIVSRKGPYDIYRDDCSLSAKDVITCLSSDTVCYPYRPSLADLDLQGFMIDTMENCWDEIAPRRPDFRTIRQRLKPLFTGILKRNIMDHMITMMEKYQTHLEELVDERTEELKEEKKKTEILLHRMLPKSVATQLMQGDTVLPETYDSVTIYFSDIVGFTSLSADSTPLEVVQFLNALYTLFDGIIRQCDVYKVETIGDAYMVVSGLPIRNGDKHAGEIATMALHLLEKVKEFQIPHRKDQPCLLRIGIHTGPCVAGVVGRTMPRYCLFGDTVNTASRMESNGLPLKIHISESTNSALSKLGGYITEERGLVPMKGKGEMRTFWLVGKQEMTPIAPVDVSPSEETSLFPAAQAKPAMRHRLKGSLNNEQSVTSNPAMQSNESLTAVVCRSPPKRTDTTTTPPTNNGTVTPTTPATGSKLLQSPPLVHQQSLGGFTGHKASNVLRPSRLLSPPSAARAAEIMRSREFAKNSSKRSSEIAVDQQQQTNNNADADVGGRLRKRSLSYPENVAALAELVAACLQNKENNENEQRSLLVDVGGGSAPLPLATPGASPGSSTEPLAESPSPPIMTPKRVTPVKLSRLLTYDEAISFDTPLLVDLNDGRPESPPKQQSSLLIPTSSPPIRKRSMSCGDAHETLQQPFSSVKETTSTASEGNPLVFLQATKGVSFFANSTSPNPKTTENNNHHASLMLEDDDTLAESPLLFDAAVHSRRHRTSIGSSSGNNAPKNHQYHWYSNGEANGNGGGGSMPRLNRLLRYFKRPASENLHDLQPEPSLV